MIYLELTSDTEIDNPLRYHRVCHVECCHVRSKLRLLIVLVKAHLSIQRGKEQAPLISVSTVIEQHASYASYSIYPAVVTFHEHVCEVKYLPSMPCRVRLEVEQTSTELTFRFQERCFRSKGQAKACLEGSASAQQPPEGVDSRGCSQGIPNKQSRSDLACKKERASMTVLSNGS